MKSQIFAKGLFQHKTVSALSCSHIHLGYEKQLWLMALLREPRVVTGNRTHPPMNQPSEFESNAQSASTTSHVKLITVIAHKGIFLQCILLHFLLTFYCSAHFNKIILECALSILLKQSWIEIRRSSGMAPLWNSTPLCRFRRQAASQQNPDSNSLTQRVI